VRPGRIVDIGCGAGAVLELADREPGLGECDLIGVEIARQLYEECVHKKAQGVFANPNVFFYRRNVLGGAVFPPRSIDTTLTFALTHEIWSYGDRMDSLREFVQAIYDHTVPGGVWINSDVCGPDGRDRSVLLRPGSHRWRQSVRATTGSRSVAGR
jgi:SAM-dependent methyltransferase